MRNIWPLHSFSTFAALELIGRRTGSSGGPLRQPKLILLQKFFDTKPRRRYVRLTDGDKRKARLPSRSGRSVLRRVNFRLSPGHHHSVASVQRPVPVTSVVRKYDCGRSVRKERRVTATSLPLVRNVKPASECVCGSTDLCCSTEPEPCARRLHCRYRAARTPTLAPASPRPASLREHPTPVQLVLSWCL